MNKKLLTYTLIGVIIFFVFIMFLPSGKQKDSDYNQGNISSDTGENLNDKDNDNDNLGVYEEKYTIEDLESTKEIAIEFSENIYHINDKDNAKYIENAIQYTTESLKNRIVETSKVMNTQPINSEVITVNAIEPNYDEEEKSIVWSIELMANIYNEADILAGKEKANMYILFIKENQEYKISEYSIMKYPKSIED